MAGLKIPFARVVCDGNEMTYVREVIESGWLTTAEKTFELEKRFSAFVGARYACAVNSCTAALHLALEALGVGPGERVFVPTMTFTASAEILRYLDAHPVFLDVEPGTNLITAGILEEAVRKHPGIRTLIVVHYGGQAAPMIRGDGKGIMDVCRRRGIRVVEDAAHAFPSRDGSRLIGSIGEATCFSFYANKTITTGEGGMLTTDDAALAARARIMRLHGMDRDIWSRFHSDKPAWEYDVVAPGFKYNMPDVNAAIGLAQLERAWELRAERERCARHYFKALEGIPGLELPALRVPMEDHAWHLFPILLSPEARVGRDRMIEMLAGKGIGASVHYKPLHRMSYYRKTYGLDPEDFPNAERFWSGGLSLPIYPSLTDEELDCVCGALRDILRQGGEG
jgi:dTDP-4-amino-4,6-dideoxygalactose transaminase